MDTTNCWLTQCNHDHCNDPEGCCRLLYLDSLYTEANIPVNLRKRLELYIDSDGTDLEEFKTLTKIQNNISEFVSSGKNLIIHSHISGNGKTSWALRLIQTYFNKNWFRFGCNCCKALFINVPKFLLAMKENISKPNQYYQHIRDNVLSADLVVWDDIGEKGFSEFEATNLFAIIDDRISNGKSNIYTSNLDDAELTAALGPRIASRICNLSVNITLSGGDKRKILR